MWYPPYKWVFRIVLLIHVFNNCHSQVSFQRFFIPSDTLNSKRVWTAGAGAFATYSVFSIGLYNTWYKKTERSSFHYFNDAGEWCDLDKVAHSYNSYIQSSNCFDGARWCGYSEKAAIIWGVSISMLFQTTIEVMDGFSSDWGFSWPDIGGNLLGAGLFAGQQLLWHEQKFKLKLSAFPKNYPDAFITGDKGTNISYDQRAKDLYGNAYFSSFMKDYNAQTFWLSFNPGIFSSSINNFWPKYLDISIGYGADNLYGGYSNEWQTNGENFIARPIRYQQYYLSLDIDLKKIRVKNNFLRTALHVINIIKIPAPTLELNSLGKAKWHWVFF
jgi:hypothetical protein